ncbi:hypothetical protein [Streptomyces sp. NBC_00691]|uniref:hypothetical protein n=1 Tax=Streptomyces sp. NBC_00691 TaxID=2903671 RepID=UPI002E31B039|nr:hypothetical protein [Streptomyces sp. NBC_00691]
MAGHDRRHRTTKGLHGGGPQNRDALGFLTDGRRAGVAARGGRHRQGAGGGARSQRSALGDALLGGQHRPVDGGPLLVAQKDDGGAGQGEQYEEQGGHRRADAAEQRHVGAAPGLVAASRAPWHRPERGPGCGTRVASC